MTERASNVPFKVAILSIVLGFGLLLVSAAVFDGQLLFGSVYVFSMYVLIYIALFTVLLKVSGALVISSRWLATAYLVGCVILAAVYYINLTTNELSVTLALVPIVMYGTYIACCGLAKRL
jgi:hypothetical protein